MRWIVLPLALAVGTWIFFLADHAPATDAALRGFPLDDAWIHLVYARSVVEEGGFHYNRGEPEAGMTSPLWVVLLAGLLAVTGPGNVAAVVLGAKILSLAFGLAVVALVYYLARELGESVFAGILAASLVALDPALTFARASGMEIQLFTALMLLALWLSLRGRWLGAAAAAGLSVIARPEGIVLFPAYALALRRKTAERGVPPTRMLLALAIAVLPAALYGAFCLHATGRPLPNTFYAKFARGNPFDPSLLYFGWKNYVHDDLPWFTLEAGTILALLGAFRWLRRDRARASLVLGSGVVLFVSLLASRTYAPGHSFYWERWLMPGYPFLLLVIASGVDEIRCGFSSIARRARARRGRAWNIGAGLAVLLLVLRLPGALRERADLFAWNAQNIDEMNVALGRWVDANLPPQAVVAVNDAGAIRYFGRRTTIDLIGLNNHRVLNRDPALGSRPLDSLGVGYLIIFPAIFPELVQNLPLTVLHEARSPHYTICDAPQDVMIVYRLERTP